MRRPAEIKEDVKQMQDRSRVSLVLNSEAFRKELEQIIDEQLSSGNYPTGLLALQQITDLLLPNNRSGQSYGSLGRGSEFICIIIYESDVGISSGCCRFSLSYSPYFVIYQKKEI